MKTLGRGGFSLIELMIAIVILGSGLLLLAGGSLAVTRDLGRARLATVAAGLADAKLDELRAVAQSTVTACTAAGFASSVTPVTSAEVTLQWTVPANGAARLVRVISTFKAAAGRTVVVDTTHGIVAC